MNKGETYKGAEIRAHVYQSPDIPNGKFLVKGWIAFPTENNVYDTQRSDDGLYDTEEAAYKSFVTSAKKFIDDTLKNSPS